MVEFLREIGLNVKILVLCRSDLFERVSGANKNKIRQDYTSSLSAEVSLKISALSNTVRIVSTAFKDF